MERPEHCLGVVSDTRCLDVVSDTRCLLLGASSSYYYLTDDLPRVGISENRCCNSSSPGNDKYRKTTEATHMG